MNKLLQFFINKLSKDVWIVTVHIKDGESRDFRNVKFLVSAKTEYIANVAGRDDFFKDEEFLDVQNVYVTSTNLNNMLGNGKLSKFIRDNK